MATDADERSRKKKKRKQADQDRSEGFDWGDWLDLWLDWDEFKRYWYIKIPFVLGLSGFALAAVRLIDEPPTWSEFGEQLFAIYEQLRDQLIRGPLQLLGVKASENEANLLLFAVLVSIALTRAVSSYRNGIFYLIAGTIPMIIIALLLTGGVDSER
jgi:hypothetical protein